MPLFGDVLVPDASGALATGEPEVLPDPEFPDVSVASFDKCAFETRRAYGGKQIFAGSALQELVPFASEAQTSLGFSSHVKSAGQSESALHATTFRLHAFVPLG